MCQEQYAPQMSYANITWCASMGKYANIYATFELNGINHVTKSTIHRQCRTTMLQPDYIYWAGLLAKSVNNKNPWNLTYISKVS